MENTQVKIKLKADHYFLSIYYFFKGSNGVQIRNFLKIIKLAFCYEAWEIFRRLSNKIIAFLEVIYLLNYEKIKKLSEKK